MLERVVRLIGFVCGICAWALPAQAGTPSCPAGQRPTLSGCRSAAPLVRSAEKPPLASDATKPGGGARVATPLPSDVVLRPEPFREGRREHLLIEEIARLERLVEATPRTATDRARLVLRLADDYAELAAVKQRELTKREIAAEDLERNNAKPKGPATPAPDPARKGRM